VVEVAEEEEQVCAEEVVEVAEIWTYSGMHQVESGMT
jgi:hypothetical protein